MPGITQPKLEAADTVVMQLDVLLFYLAVTHSPTLFLELVIALCDGVRPPARA